MAMVKIFLPFVLMVLLVILAIYLAKKWSFQEQANGDQAGQNHLSVGILLGMSIGAALGAGLRINIGLATVVGMLVGMTIAHYSRK